MRVLGFYLEYDGEAQTAGGFIQMDDISLVMIAEPTANNNLLPPTDLKVKAQQRENCLVVVARGTGRSAI